MRVLSFNIHKGIGLDRRYRLERIVTLVQAADPDILCLQEVDRGVPRSKLDDQPVLLRDQLGLKHALYQPTHRLTRGGYGNLVLSRFPIADSHHVSLRRGRRKARGAQVLKLATPSGELVVVNWHLGLVERERQWQAERLVGHKAFRSWNGLPCLILGDTNDWRNTLDKMVLRPQGLAQATLPTAKFRSFPSRVPVGSLDKAFVRGAIRVQRIGTLRGRCARRASDHLPLVVDFRILSG